MKFYFDKDEIFEWKNKKQVLHIEVNYTVYYKIQS